jgi:hypothetical protein
MKNEILEEIWRARREMENEVGGDLHDILKRAQRRTAETKRRKFAGSARLKKAHSG